MSTVSRETTGLPPEQQAIRDKCYHPTGTFIEFKKESVEQSIPDRFEEQVRRYPNRLALKSQGQELTYDQLNRAANRLAQSILAERGESLEPVAVLFDHSSQMVLALLGVMKARKVFVPIDASHPRSANTIRLKKWRSQAEGLRERIDSGKEFVWFAPYVDGPPKVE